MALIIDNTPNGQPIVPRRGQPGWGAAGNPQNIPQNPVLQHLAGIRTPGYTPNYSDLLNNDPGLMGVRNDNQFNLAQAAANRDAALNKLSYGYQGSGNRFSTLQQLAKQLKDTIFQGTKSNAAAGMLHSGEQPFMETNANYAHDLNKYDAGRQYEDAVNNALQSYLGVRQQAASAEQSAISDAADRMAANPIHQPTEGYAAYDDNLTSQYGRPVYRDMSGKLWATDDQGNTISLGTA